MMQRWSLCAVVSVAAGGALAQSALAQGVRVIHQSPNAGAVDVLIDGSVAIPGLTYPNAAPVPNGLGYIPFTTGTYDIGVEQVSTGDTLLDAPGVAIDGSVFTSIFATGLVGDADNPFAPLITIDDNTSSFGNARVRFIHGSPGTPAVDVALADGGPVIWDAVSFGQVGTTTGAFGSSAYLEVAAGTYDLDVLVDADDSLALELDGLFLRSGYVYTVVATGVIGDPTAPLGASIYIDAVPTPGALAGVGLGGLALLRRRR